jgi:hypothetical protein
MPELENPTDINKIRRGGDMGDRYFLKCPVCNRENVFGNWSNYTTKCFCGQWLAIHICGIVINEEEAKRLKDED